MAGFGISPLGISPFGSVQIVCPFGTSPFGSGSDQVVAPPGISSTETFGTPLVAISSGTFGITLFPAGREGFLDGTVSWTAATVKAALVRGYSVNTAHVFVSEVTGAGGTLVATTAVGLASKTAAGGIADAEDIVFTSVAVGALIPLLILFQASAVTGGADVAATAQRLIGYVDSSPGLPVVPTGADIAVTWSNDRTRIFML